MAGPCWARRRTAGSGSAALVGQGSHLPKPETGQQNQRWNPSNYNPHLWFKAAHPGSHFKKFRLRFLTFQNHSSSQKSIIFLPSYFSKTTTFWPVPQTKLEVLIFALAQWISTANSNTHKLFFPLNNLVEDTDHYLSSLLLERSPFIYINFWYYFLNITRLKQ